MNRKRPSLANHNDWLGAHGRRIYELEKDVKGNGKPGLLQEFMTFKEETAKNLDKIASKTSTVDLKVRWAIAIMTSASALIVGIGAWIINNQIDQGKLISALTAAMQSVLK